jgi:hypothetical protein
VQKLIVAGRAADMAPYYELVREETGLLLDDDALARMAQGAPDHPMHTRSEHS